MTTKVKGQGRDVTWCVWQVLADKSRTKRPRNTKIGRTVAHLTVNNAQQFQGQRRSTKNVSQTSAVTRPVTAETETVSYLYWTGRPTNFWIGTPVEHALSTVTPAISCEVGFLHAGGRIPCRPHPAATQLVVEVHCGYRFVLCLFSDCWTSSVEHQSSVSQQRRHCNIVYIVNNTNNINNTHII